MANAATVGAQAPEKKGEKTLPTIPFVNAAHEQFELARDLGTKLMTAAVQQLGPVEVPANGYLRNLWILVQATGGALGTGVVHEDAPFTALQNISFEDVNGAPILHPVDGYELFLINKWGGYQFFADPEAQPEYASGAADLNFTFALRVPIEISAANALGALSNMNSAANYRLQISLGASTSILSTVGTATLPSVRVRVYQELWSLPQAFSRDNAPQATEPPLLGTTQYWSKHIVDVSNGENTIQLSRVGNQIRNLIVVLRNDDAAPVRITTEFPDPLRFVWDNRQMFNEPRIYRRRVMAERYRYTLGAKDTGVILYGFAHDVLGHPGAEDDGHLWLRTVATSRLEFFGSFGGGGKLTVLTNDVAPVAQSDRFRETSATGGVPGATSI